MGICVSLRILPDRIDRESWNAVYFETLRLLRAWPGGILGFRKEVLPNGQERLCYSSDFEHNLDNSAERHWDVSGDQESGETGETFSFYANLGRYRRTNSDTTCEEVSLLRTLAQDDDVGRVVFGEKTQGHPYHYAMLAVAMLVENTFPGAAIASGDITCHQARSAQQTMQEILGREVVIPIATDGERLLNVLIQQNGMEDGAQQFFDSYRGEKVEAIKIGRRNLELSILNQCYAKMVADFPNPRSYGFYGNCQSWLNAGGELSGLIEMCCTHESGPRSDPVELAESLVHIWLTIPPNIISSLPNPSDQFVESPGIDDMFYGIMMRMSGLRGLHTQAHVDLESFLNVFRAYFPDRFMEIQEAATKRHETLLEELKTLNQTYEESRQNATETRSDSVQTSPKLANSWYLRIDGSSSEDGEKILADLAISMRNGLDNILKTEHGLEDFDQSRLKESIYRVSLYQYIVLTERGWRWIDQEMDITTLRLVLLLVSVSDNSYEFANLRRVLLEHQEVMALVRAAF